ncbi:MAG: acyl-CoA synthetase [Candidatus Competibacteraceae bacterium]|nr:acyl-CoA synthetase [Candidatus Competibacteraceae bacterium]
MSAAALPLLTHAVGERVAWWQGRPITREVFLAHVHQVAAQLPSHRFAINYCENRYLFMVAFAAVLVRAQTNLLPPSRANGDVQIVCDRYPDNYPLTDQTVKTALAAIQETPAEIPIIAAEQIAAIVFTSGSTNRSQPHLKTWGQLVEGARLAHRRFRFPRQSTVVATVPAQHMYGLETSILNPLITGFGVFGSRPFFPADVYAALAAVPEPRILVTTPAHLRVCAAETGYIWPKTEFIISATAPLSRDLATRTERLFGAPVFEIYGCSEIGSLASRRTIDDEWWQVYDGFRIDSATTSVSGLQLTEPVVLNDVIDWHSDTRFKLLGRREDMINVAGKRASLAELNHCLLGVTGIEDGVFIMPDEAPDRLTRLAALVVAPQMNERQILAALAEQIDSVFLPRPLRKVARLPRNETGKLPRQALLELLQHQPGR